MADDTYHIDIDARNGRAYVKAEGNISASKIQKTFFAIIMNNAWQKGDKSILWDLKKVIFPESFGFGDIFQTAQLSKTVAKPGKSAVLVRSNSDMVKKVANYYQAVATLSTPRTIGIFFYHEEAMNWLDS